MMNRKSKIYIAGHNGLVGSALVRELHKQNYCNLILISKKDLDLTNQQLVDSFFHNYKPEYVFLAAAKVGGIHANLINPTQFFLENMKIQLNIVESSYKYGVKRLCFLGSSCIYPKNLKQPIKEDQLLSGVLEKTNEAYAIAKIAGLKLCEFFNNQFSTNFLMTMPTSVYGINDNFTPLQSHVIPSLMSKIHDAKINAKEKVTIWGTGRPRREFINSDDLAKALIFLMKNYHDNSLINIGVQEDYKIIDLVHILSEIIKFKGEIEFDTTQPDGVERKLLDSSKIFSLGWRPEVNFNIGLTNTYSWFKKYSQYS